MSWYLACAFDFYIRNILFFFVLCSIPAFPPRQFQDRVLWNTHTGVFLFSFLTFFPGFLFFSPSSQLSKRRPRVFFFFSFSFLFINYSQGRFGGIKKPCARFFSNFSLKWIEWPVIWVFFLYKKAGSLTLPDKNECNVWKRVKNFWGN